MTPPSENSEGRPAFDFETATSPPHNDTETSQKIGSTDSTGDGRQGVYARGAWLYREAGWRGVLPLPPKAKYPPPVGFTGHDGAWPTDEQISAWVSHRENGNLVLRVDYGFIGIDVDAYGTKTGGQTLKEAETRWRPLPATYRSTARIEDEVSGIRVFRAPVGLLLKGVIKFPERNIGDIEIIQPHHRFIVAWPSINPKTGQVYRWFAPDGTLLPEGVVPSTEDIPELHQDWVDALSKDAVRDEVFDGSAPNRNSAARERINEDLYCKLIGLQGNEAPERLVASRLEKALRELTDGSGSRYDTTRDHVMALMRFHGVGRAGVPRALRELYAAYVMEVGDSRPREVAESEFLRFTDGAALLVSASMPNQNATNEEQSQESKPGRTVGLFPMSEVADDVPEWAWIYHGKGRIQRGTLSLAAGRPGAGKSTFLRWFVAQFSNGKAQGSWRNQPQKVAYIAAAEESLRFMVKPGLRAAEADMDMISYPKVTVDITGSGEQVVRFSAVADEHALTKLLVEQGVTVVVVDPIMATIEGKVDIHRNNETRTHLEPWARIAEAINGIVVGIVHLTKGSNSDVVAAITGSSAFGEVPRAVFGFAKDPESELGQRIMSQAKNSAGHEDLSLAYLIEEVKITADSGKSAMIGKFKIIGATARTVNDILSEPARRKGSALEMCKSWLQGFLTGKGRVASHDVKTAGSGLDFKERTIQRAATDLCEVEREGFPSVTYWSLPSPAKDDGPANAAPEQTNGGTGMTEDDPLHAHVRNEFTTTTVK